MNKLFQLRIERNFTQKKVGIYLGVSRQVYANYEKEINQPTPDILCKLADLYNCSIDYLVGRSDEFGNVTESPQIDGGLFEDRREVLELYDRLNDEAKDSILFILRGLSESKKN